MNPHLYEWAVVGAGPAGIASIGKLLDSGIKPQNIVWVDPYFQVGDLGKLWVNVSSNTTVRLFQQFLKSCPSFLYDEKAKDFKLNDLPLEETCCLKWVVDPLQWITSHLQRTVQCVKTQIHKAHLFNRAWQLHSDHETITATNVILATGAKPINLNYPEVATIPFETAIDKERLQSYIKQDGTYAVFGSSHSAIMIIQSLIELEVNKVINFYRSPCRYAIDMGNWILFDNTGLKGQTALWARCNIDGVQPKNLLRYQASQKNITRYLPECNQAIYAVGFKARDDLLINDVAPLEYNSKIGILAPGLFGVGIAFPELKSDPFGHMEHQVGLWKFMTYLNKVMPIWLKYHS